MCIEDMQRQRGSSLIELIMFIVIVSVALAGILLVMNTVTRGSADPLVRKQALAIAYSLLDEIELRDFFPAVGMPSCPPNPALSQVTAANRVAPTHIVCDYNGFAMAAGITSMSGAAIAGLGGYGASVAISGVALGVPPYQIPATSAVQITVTVTAPGGDTVTATGYRTAY